MKWSGETLAGQEGRYWAQQIVGVGEDMQNHSVKKEGENSSEGCFVAGNVLLTCSSELMYSVRRHGTKKNLFCSL